MHIVAESRLLVSFFKKKGGLEVEVHYKIS